MSLPIKSDALEVVSGGAANPLVTSGTTDPTLGLSRPEGSIYLRYVVAGGQAFIKFGPANTDWVVLATGGGGIGGSLDAAYDFGGAGAGRTIIADAGGLQLDAFTTNAQAALTINRQPGAAAAAVGIDLVLSGNVNASGVGVQIADAGSGTSIRVTKSNAGSVYFADLTNAGAKALEVVVTAAPTSVSPISVVANTTGTTAALISVSKIPGVATAGDAISVSMGANTTGAGISSTSAGSGPAVAGTNSSSSAGAMAIRNTNVAGPVDFYAIDSVGTSQMSWGYGNTGYSDTARVGRAYAWRNAGVDMVFARTNIVDAILKADGKLGIGTATALTAQLEVNGATPDIFINGSTSSLLRYPMTGVAAPTFTTRSAGTKIVLFPQIGVSAVDYGLGIEGSTLWYSVPTATSSNHHRWYCGTTERMNLRGDGVLSITQSLADPADGTGAITIKNTLSTSIAQITWQNHLSTFQAALGRNNTSPQGLLYWYFSSPTSAGLLFNSAGGSHMNIFAGVADGAGFQLHSGSSTVVSDANTGRMRYVTAGQKFQFSLNGGAYVDVPVAAAAFTAGSVLFANATGQIAQDNATFRWVDATNNLMVGTSAVTANFTNFPLTVSTSSTDIVSYMWNTNTAGYGAIGFLDSALAFKVNMGFGNSTSAAAFANRAFLQTSGCDFVLIDAASTYKFFFGMANNATVMQMANGSAGAVSEASTGRIRYNTTGQKFQVSMNGAAYVDLQTGADFALDIGDAIGASTVGSVLFVGATNVLQQDNANFFWDDTNNRLGVGTASPVMALHVRNTAATSGFRIEAAGVAVSATVEFNTVGITYGAVGYSITPNKNFLYSNTTFLSPDWYFVNDTQDQFRFGMSAASAFIEQVNGSSAAVSAANTGRLRYNTTGQKYQVSTNGGAYVDLQTAAPFTLDIGDAIGSSTVGSVLFVGAGNVLQQDNAGLFWDDTNNRFGLNVGGAPSYVADIRGSLGATLGGVINTNSAGNSGWDLYDNLIAHKGTVAYGNTLSATAAWVQGLLYSYSTGPDWVWANGTGNMIRFGMTAGSTFLEQANGSGAAVSAASTGRIRYNTTGQKFQVSTNGTSYVDLATGSTAIGVERLSVTGAASPALDVTYISGVGTALSLANGATDGFVKKFIVTGGSGTITPASLADGDVLTYAAGPANVSFVWDSIGVTWHVLGSPYNMVTT